LQAHTLIQAKQAETEALDEEILEAKEAKDEKVRCQI
jgi:hypothetical protein